MLFKRFFHTFEMGIYGALLPYVGSYTGMRIAVKAAHEIQNPMLAGIVTQNAMPAFTVGSALYIGNMIKNSGPSVPFPYKLAAGFMAATIGSSVAMDHVNRGPMISYVQHEGQGYAALRPL
jgi:hypothetical protein